MVSLELTEVAVVAELGMLVRPKPLPTKLSACTWPAEKFPDSSRDTMLLAVFVGVAPTADSGMFVRPKPSPENAPEIVPVALMLPLTPLALMVITIAPLLRKLRIWPLPLVLSKTPGMLSGLAVCTRRPTVLPVVDDSSAFIAVPVVLLFSANSAASPAEMA